MSNAKAWSVSQVRCLSFEGLTSGILLKLHYLNENGRETRCICICIRPIGSSFATDLVVFVFLPTAYRVLFKCSFPSLFQSASFVTSSICLWTPFPIMPAPSSFFSPLVVVVLPLLISRTHAWRPSENDCNNKICLTSFRWCESGGGKRDCYYPDFVYPQEDYAGPFPALIWEKEYDLTWKVKDSQGNGDVNITWEFQGGDRPKGVFWSTRRFLFLPPSLSLPTSVQQIYPSAKSIQINRH